jgi:hypothetical protein
MTLNGEKMIRAAHDEFYYCESRNIIVEKHFENWRGYHTTDKWGESSDIFVEGTFRQVVNELKKFFKKSS